MDAKPFSKIFSYTIPRTSDLLFVAVFFAVMAQGHAMLNSDGDLPRHLLMGKYILEGNPPPTTELFAFPYEGREYVPHEWGTGVIFYLLFQGFDLNGIMFVAGLLLASTFTLIFLNATRSNNQLFLTLVLVSLGAFVTSIHWITRPHLFSMLFTAIWLILIDDLYRNQHKMLGAPPMVMLLWANIHAEYIAGFLILGAYLADSIWSYWRIRTPESLSSIKVVFIVLISSFACSLINPSGFQTWSTVTDYVNNSYLMSTINETKPPNFTELRFTPLLMLYVVSLAILLSQRKNFSAADFFLIMGFGLMNAVSARNAHLFGVVAPLILARNLKNVPISPRLNNIGQMFTKLDNVGRGTAIPILLATLLGVFLLVGPYKGHNRFDPEYFPVQAVQWLEQNPQHGHMFNHFDWGGYLLLHLWPSQKVFIESQTDTHGDLTQSYLTVTRRHAGWEDTLNAYDIQWVIIPPHWELTDELISRDWNTLYGDDTAIILHRP